VKLPPQIAAVVRVDEQGPLRSLPQSASVLPAQGTRCTGQQSWCYCPTTDNYACCPFIAGQPGTCSSEVDGTCQCDPGLKP
jgi:hypothetical protein